MPKQHTEDRQRRGYTLCGREMPRDHNAWSDLESCFACARVEYARDERREQREHKNVKTTNAPRNIKICRRCDIAIRPASWKCRECGTVCCEHLCRFKSDSLATCANCQAAATVAKRQL